MGGVRDCCGQKFGLRVVGLGAARVGHRMNRRRNEHTKYRGRAVVMGTAMGASAEEEKRNAKDLSERRKRRGQRDLEEKRNAQGSTASKVDEQIKVMMDLHRTKAAAVIQAHFRGWKARKRVKLMRGAALRIQGFVQRWLRRRRDEERRAYHHGQHLLRSERETRHRVIQHLEREKALLLEQSGSEWEDWQMGRERKAAVVIQRYCRKRWARRRIEGLIAAKDAQERTGADGAEKTQEEMDALASVRERVREREEAALQAFESEAPDLQPRRLAALQQEMWRRRAESGDSAVPFTESAYRRRAQERRRLLGMYLARKDTRQAADRKTRRLQKETAMLLARLEGLPAISDIGPGAELSDFPPAPDDDADYVDLEELTTRIANLKSSTSMDRMLRGFEGGESAHDKPGTPRESKGPALMSRRAAAETAHNRLLQQMKRQVLPWSKWSYVS